LAAIAAITPAASTGFPTIAGGVTNTAGARRAVRSSSIETDSVRDVAVPDTSRATIRAAGANASPASARASSDTRPPGRTGPAVHGVRPAGESTETVPTPDDMPDAPRA